MRDEETRLLFQALSQILANQDEIKKHLGLNKLDSEYGWNDEDTIKLSRKCSEIANDILSIDENEFPYFVFKNTTVDDGVKRWFKKYDQESDEYVSCAMSENTDDFYAEFVFFKDGRIDKFVSNKDYRFES